MDQAPVFRATSELVLVDVQVLRIKSKAPVFSTRRQRKYAELTGGQAVGLRGSGRRPVQATGRELNNADFQIAPTSPPTPTRYLACPLIRRQTLVWVDALLASMIATAIRRHFLQVTSLRLIEKVVTVCLQAGPIPLRLQCTFRSDLRAWSLPRLILIVERPKGLYPSIAGLLQVGILLMRT